MNRRGENAEVNGNGEWPGITTLGALAEALSAFLLSREALGATPATLRTYAADLAHFAQTSGITDLADLTSEGLERYLAGLRVKMAPISTHRHYRALRTFCRWCERTGRLVSDPMAGLRMRLPRTLPRVPTGEAVRRLMAACPDTPEGQRNRAMIALAADGGLRKEELRRLRIGDVDVTTRLIQVRGGKGQRDGVTFFGEAAALLLRAWLAIHPNPRPTAFLFVTRVGVPLGPWSIVHILHRLSRRAGLDRPIGPHALRHYAATALLRRTGDLELVRRVLRHTTLAMALRYATLTQTEIAVKFEAASPLDHLWTSQGPQGYLTREGRSRRREEGDTDDHRRAQARRKRYFSRTVPWGTVTGENGPAPTSGK